MIARFTMKDVPMNIVEAAGFPYSNVGAAKPWVSFGPQSLRIEAVLEMHRKNADAVVRATYVMLDGLTRMAQRQGELFAVTLNDHANAARDVCARALFEERASKQVGAVRHLYFSSIDSLRQQSDIAAETNVAVGNILGTRLNEALDEFGSMFGKPRAPTTPSSVPDAAVVAEPAADVDAAVVAEPAADVDAAVVAEPAADVDAAVVVEPAAEVDAAVVAEPTADADAAVVAEPAADVDAAVVAEAAADVRAAAGEATLVDAVPIASPAAKSNPKKASLPTKPARRPRR
jgi:Phasin protein